MPRSSPWVWAAPAKRPGGGVIYTFDRLAAGRRSEASELLRRRIVRGTRQKKNPAHKEPGGICSYYNAAPV
jgi:hypothetical protein